MSPGRSIRKRINRYRRIAGTVRPSSAAVLHTPAAPGSSASGGQVRDRALAAGYPYRKVPENIAAGQPTAAEVVRGWMDSPGHRSNILDAELTRIGVGHVLGGTYGVVWTQVFGTPR